jgi:hypothetical protein
MAVATKRAKLVAGALFALALVTGVVLARTSSRPDRGDLGLFHGVRLGMTASAVRERFEAPALGSWRSLPATGAGDVVLAWAAAKGPATATFELHNGMLVAVRATVEATDAESKRPGMDSSRAIVRAHALDGGVIQLTLLARDCPTHHDEAERLAAGK